MQELLDERAALQEKRRRVMERAEVSTHHMDGMPHVRRMGSAIEDGVCEASAIDVRIAEIDEAIRERLRPFGWPLCPLAELHYLKGYSIRQAARVLGYNYSYACTLMKRLRNGM